MLNSRNSFLAPVFLLLLLSRFSPHSAAPPGGSEECQIVPHQMLITCFGPSITDTSLLMLKHTLIKRFHRMYFEQLLISSTSISMINADAFADSTFRIILISDNPSLKRIEETAFKVTETSSVLQIINNPMLKSSTLYKLADRLAVKDQVDFDHNSFEEVPSHAFNEMAPTPPPSSSSSAPSSTTTFLTSSSSPVVQKKLHLQKLDLPNNQIKHISSNAFHLMDSIKEIALTTNKVEHISRHAFNLANHSGPSLVIKLDDNALTAASFEADFIQLNNATSLELNLRKNAIEELPEAVFKPLLAKNVQIDLTGNRVNCHSVNTAWLFKAENSQLLHKLKGVSC